MKVFGYSVGNEENLLEMNEVTIQCNAEMLKKIAKFLNKCANEMSDDEGWEHEHLSDFLELVSDEIPDLIVFKE